MGTHELGYTNPVSINIIGDHSKETYAAIETRIGIWPYTQAVHLDHIELFLFLAFTLFLLLLSFLHFLPIDGVTIDNLGGIVNHVRLTFRNLVCVSWERASKRRHDSGQQHQHICRSRISAQGGNKRRTCCTVAPPRDWTWCTVKTKLSALSCGPAIGSLAQTIG